MIRSTFTQFIKEVLEPNFNGKEYNVSSMEIKEYQYWLIGVWKINKTLTLTFHGCPLINNKIKYHAKYNNHATCKGNDRD